MALHRSRRPVLLLLGGVGAAAAAAELPPYPTVRYTAWDDLAPPVRAAAAAAGYGEKSWNRPHTLAAEELDYASLEPAMHDLLAAAAVSDASWDCHVNHYRNYEWQELEERDVQKSYKALGWDEDMWCGSEEPDEEGWYWGDLTPAQQDAAAAACYSPQTWDEVSIPLWGEDDQEGGVTGERDAADPYSAQEQQVQEEKQVIYAQLYPDDDRGMEINGPASAHNDRGIPVPLFRYDPWDALAPEVRSAAARAGYKEKDWNAIRTNGLEKMGWETIGDKHPATQKALRQLGFSEATWDAYMLHYNTYEWGELRDAGVQDYFKALGYSRNDWDQDSLAPACGLYWPDLTDEQREAAYQVGYFRETWDEGEARAAAGLGAGAARRAWEADETVLVGVDHVLRAGAANALIGGLVAGWSASAPLQVLFSKNAHNICRLKFRKPLEQLFATRVLLEFFTLE